MVSARTQQVADLFDLVAPTYDQVGVELFSPIARRLVELLEPRRGDRVVDLGCGRGALTLPLADSVGATGTVLAGDVSPAMVEATRRAAAGLPQVTVAHLDAAEPALAPRSADVVAASLVIFFLPDPADALRRWVEALAPGGRLGVTTFGAQDEVWKSVDELFDPYLPTDMLDARTSGARGPFGSSEATSELLRSVGLTAVETVVEPLTVAFDDPAMWRQWTMSVGQRRMWDFVPEQERPELFDRAAALLQGTRDGGGPIRLRQDMRYSIGTAPVS